MDSEPTELSSIPFDTFVEYYKRYLRLIGELDKYCKKLTDSMNLKMEKENDGRSNHIHVYTPTIDRVQKIHEVIESINNQKRILSRELLQITSIYIRSLDTINDTFVQKLILHGIRPLAQFSNQNYTSKFIEFMRTSKFDESICLCHRLPYGDMVLCSNPDCPNVWYHFECVGLPPYFDAPVDWMCPICREKQDKHKSE